MWGAFANCQVWDSHQAKGKISQTNNHSDHASPSGTRLVDQGFVLIQDNGQSNTSKPYQSYNKSKEKQQILLPMSLLVLSAVLNLFGL